MQSSAVSIQDALPVTVIRPARGWISLKLGGLWKYCELLYFLTWRDIKARYKQTVLGAAWAIIQLFAVLSRGIICSDMASGRRRLRIETGHG